MTNVLGNILQREDAELPKPMNVATFDHCKAHPKARREKKEWCSFGFGCKLRLL